MTGLLFLTILEISITTGAAILIIKLLFFSINQNYAARRKKFIWLIVAVRLLIPVPVSFFNPPIQLNFPDAGYINNIADTASTNISGDSAKEAASDHLNPNSSAGTKTAAGALDIENKDNGKPDTGYGVLKGKSLVHIFRNLTWLELAFFIWASGSILFMMYHLTGYLFFRKQILRWGRIVKEERIQDSIAHISKQLFLKKQLKVYESDKAASPSLIGFIHPVLVLPPDRYSDQELAFILKHELMHYRLNDLWYKLLVLLANAVHWFNPAVYLLRKEAYIDLELACDDEVIKSMPFDDRKKYGETILFCIHRQKMRRTDLTTGFNDTAKAFKDRLKNIMNVKKKRNGRGIVFLCLSLLISLGALVTFTGGEQKQKGTDGLTWYGAVGLVPEKPELPDNQIEDSADWNEFLNSDKTVALVARIPEAEVEVYGLKENGTEEGTYTLRGICVKQGKEIQVLDTGWGVYDELPKLGYQDYDSDGVKETAMIVRSARGTNLSVNDLHILKKNNKDGWTDYLFTSSDWQKILSQKMDYQVTDGILTISIDGKDTGYRIDVPALEEEWGDKLTSVFFGNYGEFTFDNDRICLQVLPSANVGDWVTPQEITDAYISLEVTFHGEFLINGFTQDPDKKETSDINSERKTEIGSETAGTEATADQNIREYLGSPDGKLLKETADSFVKAYFSADKEAAFGLLAEAADYDSFIYLDYDGNEADVYDKLDHLLAKWDRASDAEANVQYEYEIEGEDSFTYLDLDLKKDGKSWVVNGIFLEK